MKMKNNKNSLDEMQREKRNSIGNQMFMLMFYALLIDIGLYGYGVRWLSYPTNVMVIIIVCMSIYLVRIIAVNAYLPPKAQNRRNGVILMITIVFSIVLAITGILLLGESPAETVATTKDNSAIILAIASVVGLLMALIVMVITKVNNKDEKED